MTDIPPPHGTASARLAVPGWLYLPLLSLPLWAWALWTVPPAASAPVLVASAAALASLLVLALSLNRRDRRVRELTGEIAGLRADTAALAEDHLPRLAERLRQGDSAETALHRVPAPGDPGGRAVLSAVATQIAAAERRRASAMVACATAAGRVQALATTMLADLRRMQERHGDGAAGSGDDVLGDLMHLDHSTAQVGRIADSIAVLTGARSGRRWGRAIAMESIVRGAMGRIGDYRRVRVHNVCTQAVAGFAAEGVVHCVAEILDNAARFSPPTSEVHVHVEEVQAGIAVMVEDGGLVMGEEALERARRTVESGLDLATISGTRLGLAVVGQLAQRYGLSVSFRSSSRGGTAVVLLLPQKLIKPLPRPRIDSSAAPARGLAPSPASAFSAPVPSGTSAAADPTPPPAATPTATAADQAEKAENGLPQRRRGMTLAAAEKARPAPADSGPATPTKGFGAFRSAVRGQDPTGSSKDA
ncbi:histidine kinase/DNA gyrase B/HSP90-like ATPase [Nocardiopsis sp. Huas11]|uniref:ATP-binding protein n=1 Tax=Nocardiopsis sp. Huas11 TaxID=2183912 RepID=UPI000EB59FA7|nr:ATP-binding protein [Nocardiopsis sp. Huas11]RKS08002.1 histidine kinase/DNA gyrase B/HSP90-like ATPase [Nocardiopsis sp. Huas11]